MKFLQSIFKHIPPADRILLALAGAILGLGLLFGGGLPVVEYIPGLTKAVYSAPPAAIETGKQLGKVEEALLAAGKDILETKDRKGGFKYKTGIEASLCRASWCKKLLVGSGICTGGENEDCAACLTAHLREKFGTEDYDLDTPCPHAPGKSWREFWHEELTRTGLACGKFAKT